MDSFQKRTQLFLYKLWALKINMVFIPNGPLISPIGLLLWILVHFFRTIVIFSLVSGYIYVYSYCLPVLCYQAIQITIYTLLNGTITLTDLSTDIQNNAGIIWKLIELPVLYTMYSWYVTTNGKIVCLLIFILFAVTPWISKRVDTYQGYSTDMFLKVSVLMDVLWTIYVKCYRSFLVDL